MITATGKKEPYITELTDGIHLFSADTPLADGGSGLHQRPTDILISALAACVNITTRMLLDKESLPYDRVVVQADLDRIDTAHVDIQGDIPREKKEAIIARVSRCPVCKLLRSPADVIVS